MAKITSEEERRFYEDHYSRFRDVRDEDLIWNRRTFLRDLNDPSKSVYERRKLYGRAFDRMCAEGLKGKRLLDYGCGLGEWGTLLATEGAHATLLDLSANAVELGLRRARASGAGDRVDGVARDASDLSCFADGEFDLVFACAALHHTLKYPGALSELVRVMKPGAKLVLVETYGNNALLNGLRRFGWKLSGQSDDAGEDILISDAEIGILREYFDPLDVEPVNLTAMIKRVFRGRYQSTLASAVLSACERLDEWLLRQFRFLRAYCGEALIIGVKRR